MAQTFLTLLRKLITAAVVQADSIYLPSDGPVVSLETSCTSFRSSSFDHEYDSISFEVVDGSNCFLQGTYIHSPEPSAFLFTDASRYRWGAHLERMRLSFHGRWTKDQSRLHINILKIMAIRFALKKAIQYILHSCVMISTDNTTVVSYINKQEGTHSPSLCIEV